MPKETFNNLSSEKKKRIFQAAVQEFSTKRFSEASINQIIKTAEIPRGSFYQYFNDKEDLYLYMVTEIGKEKVEVFHHTQSLYPEADFFKVFFLIVKNIMDWAGKNPMYNQIGLLMEMDISEITTKLPAIAAEGFKMLYDMINRDKQRGLIKPDVDTELVVEMIYSLISHFQKKYYQTGSKEIMLNEFKHVINIIKGGIACV